MTVDPLRDAGVDSDLAWRFLESRKRDAHAVFPLGWEILDRLPPRSTRSEHERRAADFVRDAVVDLCRRFTRENRGAIYDRLTGGMTRSVRADELVFRAAEHWPGLVPTREEVALESERKQRDKDGRELQQGLFLSELLSDPEIGSHLCHAMLEPTEEARTRLPELLERGAIDLETVRLEVRGRVGYVELRHPKFLNAEDDDTRGPQEVAVDLVLLHPQLEMGVLRGGTVAHPKYAGRRVFPPAST